MKPSIRWGLATVAFFLSVGLGASADGGLSPLMLELLRSSDRDTRGLALQQIREGFPGSTVTRELVELLPTLPPEGQSALVQALGDRRDATARPAFLRAAASPVEDVRVSALLALAQVGEARDVALLGERAAAGSAREREVARRALARLAGDDVNKEIVARFSESTAGVKIELLDALTARKAAQAMPLVLRNTQDPDRGVRLAALAAARELADSNDTAALISALRHATDNGERNAAEAALVALAGRRRAHCLGAVVEALPSADVPMRQALLQALAAIGSADALGHVARFYQDPAASIRDEALRILSNWPDAAVAPYLLTIGQRTSNTVHHVLALRGLVQAAVSRDSTRPDLALLRETLALAKTPEEKRLVLGALGSSRSPDSAALAAQALEDPTVVEEAALAVVSIAERLKIRPPAVQRAVREAKDRAKDPAIRARAEEWLNRK